MYIFKNTHSCIIKSIYTFRSSPADSISPKSTHTYIYIQIYACTYTYIYIYIQADFSSDEEDGDFEGGGAASESSSGGGESGSDDDGRYISLSTCMYVYTQSVNIFIKYVHILTIFFDSICVYLFLQYVSGAFLGGGSGSDDDDYDLM